VAAAGADHPRALLQRGLQSLGNNTQRSGLSDKTPDYTGSYRLFERAELTSRISVPCLSQSQRNRQFSPSIQDDPDTPLTLIQGEYFTGAPGINDL
jgi:hypothetical protein